MSEVVTVVGAGGGGRAVTYALLNQGVPEIRLVNRTAWKPLVIAEAFGGPITPIPIYRMAQNA